MDKKLLAGVAGLFDPKIIKLAQEIAEKIPEGSFFRSNLSEHLLGVLRGIVETHAESFSTPTSVVVEKLGNFSGFLSAILTKTKGKTKEGELLQVFLAETLQRLRSAENPQKEFERIKEELTLFNQIIQLAHPQKESSSPALERFNKRLQELRDRLKEA